MVALAGATGRMAFMFSGAFIALFFLVLLFSWAPTIETRLFPVLENERPVMERLDADGWTVFSLTVDKVRPCDLVDSPEAIQWFAVLEDGSSMRVPFETLRDDVVRPGSLPDGVGRYRLGGWRVKLPQEALTHTGALFYDCHWPWTTVTRLGPFPAWFHSAEPGGDLDMREAP